MEYFTEVRWSPYAVGMGIGMLVTGIVPGALPQA
jgi:hypothetical protein